MIPKDLQVTLHCDTADAIDALDLLLSVRKDLASLLLKVPHTSEPAKIVPTFPTAVSLHEVRERFGLDVLLAFDASGIEHCLKRLKARVLPNKVIGQ